jgi:ABC-type multidrug transport system fused ATPase/permease subunit
MNAGNLTAFFLLFSNFEDIFGSLQEHWEKLIRDFPDAERFLELMKKKPTKKRLFHFL